MSGWLRRGFRRLGLTEGQRYTVAILVVVAVLLTTSLTRLHGRVAELVSAPGPAVTATTVVPPATRPPVTTAGARPTGGAQPSPSTPRLPVIGAPPTTARTTTPTTTGGDEEEPEEVPCATEAAVQQLRGVIEQVDVLVGGLVPSATLVSALAVVTGCSQTDPVVLLLAGLIEVGRSLPDLGLGALEFPVLPFLEVPDPLVVLAQPLRPLLDPICGTIGTVGLLFSQVGPSYPYPLDAAFAVSLFYATATCGQIQEG